MRHTILLVVLVTFAVANEKYSQHFFTNISKNTSTTCNKQLEEFEKNLKTTSWAFQMLDSYSKIPRGLGTLKFEDLGEFQQCINIQNEGTTNIYGKYCLGYVSISNESSLLVRDSFNLVPPVWGFCVPNACITDDIQSVGSEILKDILDQTISVSFSDLLCQTVKEVDPEFSTAAIIAIIFLVCLFFFVLVSTFYDIYCVFYSSKCCPLLVKGFSFYTNSKKIFKVNKPNVDHLPCLDGLKFMSMMWVIGLHQFSVPMSGSLTNLDYLKHWPDKISSMFILSGDISVDTFLIIGGTLVSYGFFKSRHKNLSFNLLQFYLHRYLRLTTSFSIVVLISATLIRYTGSGPKWPFFTLYFQNNCEENWWSALLYVQNYVNPTKMCVGQTWYLNVDMQLYVVSPVALFLLWKNRIAGLFFLISCCLASMGTTFYQVWLYSLPGLGFGIYNSRSSDYQKHYYLLTHTRATPWLIGIILGFYIFKIRQQLVYIRLNKYVVGLLWILCFGILLTCVLGGHDLFIDRQYHVLPNAFYAALVRPVWALGISWIILACNINYAGPVNWILSLPIFQLLNRFTYSIYLTHVTTLYGITFSKKWPDYFNTFYNVYNFWGTLWINAGFAILLVFIAESPIFALEKMIIGFLTKKKSNCEAEKGAINIAFEKY